MVQMEPFPHLVYLNPFPCIKPGRKQPPTSYFIFVISDYWRRQWHSPLVQMALKIPWTVMVSLRTMIRSLYINCYSALENETLFCLLLIFCRFVCPFPYDVINRCSGEWLKYSHSIGQRFVLAELMQFFCLLTFNVSGDSTEARSQFVEAGTATGLQLSVIHLIFSGNLRLSCRSSLGRPS